MKIKSIDQLTLVQHDAKDDLPISYKSARQELAGMAGYVTTDEQRRQGITITRNFKLAGTDLDDQWDDLVKKSNKGRVWLVLEMRDSTTRGTWAKLSSVVAPQGKEAINVLPVTLTFEIAWPWFEWTADIDRFDTGVVFGTGNFDGNYSSRSGAGLLTIDNTGGDRITTGYIVISGASTNPKVHNLTTDEWLQYTGSLASGDMLIVDLHRHGVYGLPDVWDNISLGDMQTRLFSLATGENTIDFSGGGDLEIHWARVS